MVREHKTLTEWEKEGLIFVLNWKYVLSLLTYNSISTGTLHQQYLIRWFLNMKQLQSEKEMTLFWVPIANSCFHFLRIMKLGRAMGRLPLESFVEKMSYLYCLLHCSVCPPLHNCVWTKKNSCYKFIITMHKQFK